jgi:hypothetical protein
MGNGDGGSEAGCCSRVLCGVVCCCAMVQHLKGSKTRGEMRGEVEERD